MLYLRQSSLNHFSDAKKKKNHILNDQIWELKLAREQQEKAIKTMKNFGMHFGQKYDFESISKLAKKKVDAINAIKLAKNNFKNQNSLENLSQSEISYTKTNNINNFNIKTLKTKPFKTGKFDYDALEQIKISNNFPKYRIASVESCQSNKGKKWKNTLIFFADENLFWAVKSRAKGKYFPIFGGKG